MIGKRRKRLALVSLAVIGSLLSGCEYDLQKSGANTPFRTKRPSGFAGKVPDRAEQTRQGGRAFDTWRGKAPPASKPGNPPSGPEDYGSSEVIPQQYSDYERPVMRPRSPPVPAEPGMDTGPSVWGSAAPPSYRAQHPAAQPIITQRAALPMPGNNQRGPPPGSGPGVPPRMAPSVFPSSGPARQPPPSYAPGRPPQRPAGPPMPVAEMPPPGAVQHFPDAPRLGFIWPVDGEISSVYGWRQGKPHTGLDLRAPNGTTIVASQAGKVIFSGQMKGYGNTIILDHQNGFFTVYGHNQANLVKKVGGTKSTWVKRGQPIARVGQSGNATGPHVHFEVRRSNNPLDPLKFLPPRQFAMAR